MRPRKSRPPRIPAWLMECIIRSDRCYEMQNDFDELFRIRANEQGIRKAVLRYWLDAISVCCRPAYWKRAHSPIENLAIQSEMIKTELLVAIRTIQKQIGFSILNAGGLAVGLVCVFFIGLFVRHELVYDRHHDKGDRIYRVTANYFQSNRHWAPIGPPVGPALKDDFPEIERLVRFFPAGSAVTLKVGDRFFKQNRSGFADSTYFQVFSFNLLSGSAESALDDVGDVALSARTARKIFGSTEVVGRVLEVPGRPDATVSAVFADPPEATHQPVDVLFAMAGFYAGEGDWLETATTWAGFHTYLLLSPTAEIADFKSRLPAFVDRLFEARFEGPASQELRLELQPLFDIHLHSALEKEYVANGDVRYVYTFSLVALFVLLIALLNFVNLSTARASMRMKEIGVRKSFGAVRWQLMRQFLTEAIVHALMGLLIATTLVVLLLPAFEQVSGIELELGTLFTPLTAALAVGIALVSGIVAGIYPAFVLSSFRPARVFRGETTGRGGVGLRQGLVVFQFAVSMVLLTASGIVWSQLSYMRSTDLGFDKEHVLRISMSEVLATDVTNQPGTYREQLTALPNVVAVSQASDSPGSRYSLEGMTIVGRSEESHMMRVAWRSDHYYDDALGLELVAGRGFSEAAPRDTSAWLINEAAVRKFGLEHPTEELLRWDDYVGPIVGVVRDFNFASMHREVEPLVIPLRLGYGDNLLVRFRGAEVESILSGITGVLEALTPGAPFDFAFLDDEVDRLYQREDRLGDVITYFSLLAILVACLGLFGLAAFAADQRRREIGIRKTLGASAVSIVRLLSGEFAVLVAIAFALSVPVVLYMMSAWLGQFAYRIQLSPWYFVGSGVAVLVLALATVSFQAAKAAIVDPMRSIHRD